MWDCGQKVRRKYRDARPAISAGRRDSSVADRARVLHKTDMQRRMRRRRAARAESRAAAEARMPC
ncbi:hypothetical protein F7R25_07820 [Burkholderia stagnalis]|nr:hypothetical protein F7R25_07820 [Burkholderia stagnalis]